MTGVQGKVVLITGASSGIGRATAILLAQNGMKVVACARREKNLKELVSEITKNGGVASYQVVDVSKKEQVQAAVDYTVKTYGKLDVIFNNAGDMPLAPVKSLKVDEWDRMIDINIKGVLYGIAAAVPVMLKQGFGHIINTGSTASNWVSPTAAVYCGTKYAVRAITEGLKIELGDKIKSTLICPGVTETELGFDITDKDTSDYLKILRKNSLTSETIARSVLYSIDQDEISNVSQVIIESRNINN